MTRHTDTTERHPLAQPARSTGDATFVPFCGRALAGITRPTLSTRLKRGGPGLSLAAFACLAVLLLSLSACSRPESGDARNASQSSGEATRGSGKRVVGFSQMDDRGPWRLAETGSIRAEAAKRSDRFELVVTDGQNQTSKQVSDVEDLVARGVDFIFLAPREYEGLAPALQSAREAGVPVFLIDREAAGTAGEDYVTVLKSDFVEQGRRAAEWLAKAAGGRARIVELTGTPGSSVARDRAAGFREVLQKYPDMEIVASQTAEFNRAQALEVMENIIQAKGREMTAIYAHNDEMAHGAVQALKDAGLNPGRDVLVVSIDGQRTALEAIIAGEMNATVESNPRFGPLAFDTLERFLSGEKLPPVIPLTDRLFDSTNARQFLDEAY